jgi:hypothetical protein|tara:strand:- start:1619 stop:1942 length:324 start_codon:yes stop_codon:yes gene_type:complete
MLFKVFFKDAYKWYTAKLLHAYDNDKVKPRTKRKKFSTLKRKSPKVPEYTCPQIDSVLDTLSSSPNIKGREFQKIKNKLEKLRTQNELLRESGVYWYEIAKGILTGK